MCINVEPFPGVVTASQGTKNLMQNSFFLSQEPSADNKLWVRFYDLPPHHSPCWDIYIYLVLCMQSLLKCETILQDPENNVSLTFITLGSHSLSSLPQHSLYLGGMSYYRDVSFKAKHFTVSYSLNRGLCISHHLMQKEGSLMRAEKCTYLWV